jgi:hypothetical protein
VAEPVVDAVVPGVPSDLAWVVALVELELPATLAAPVVVLPLPPLLIVVVALVPVAPALPLEAWALLLVVLLTL